MINNHYWEEKERLSQKAKEHTEEMQEKYGNSNILDAVKKTKIYDEEIIIKPNILVVDMDIVSAAKTYQIGITALLNFASYKNPGGMFLAGSKAQEECLCHASYLYNVLKEFQEEYYDWNRQHLNRGLYKNRALYTPDVMFESEDGSFYCDVITCAAPNKSVAQKYQNISDEENRVVMKERIRFVFNLATKERVNTLILGAWGCGVFSQNAQEVAELFREVILEMPCAFQNIVFAIPDDQNGNYQKFVNVFS